MAKYNTDVRIYQAVIYVTFQNGSTRSMRISRAYWGTILHYWQVKRSNVFKYAKIYEILHYKYKTHHQLGNKIGWITQKSSLYNPTGLFETQASQNYKRTIK